ncbi:MAG: HAD family hydrolase [Terracidiphilus sp.]
MASGTIEAGVYFNITWMYCGGRLALRAVVFDYGIVLTGPPSPEAWANLLRISGLPQERFEPLYWADRRAYDVGHLSGLGFWQRFLLSAGMPANWAKAEELNRWDARLWTVENPAMLAWQLQLKERGLKTAILSNIGDSVVESIEREFSWIHRFDVLVWSYQLGIAKPDPVLYRHTLDELGTRPEETLFIDDKLENVEAARALGMQAIQYSSVAGLRADLIAAGLDAELPLPA